MKGILKVSLAVLAGVVLLGAPAFAHHGSNSSYDMNKTITVKGTVTEWVWANPHCQLFFDVKDDKGNIVHWAAETNSPGVLARAGWERTSFKVGDQITVSMNPSLANSPVGLITRVVLANGQVVGRGAGGSPSPN